MEKMLSSFLKTAVLSLLISCCKSAPKSDLFSSQLDSDLLSMLIISYRSGNDGKFPESLNELLRYKEFDLDNNVANRLKVGWVYRAPPTREQHDRDSDFTILEKSVGGKVVKVNLRELFDKELNPN
jgi:hypothetical protein